MKVLGMWWWDDSLPTKKKRRKSMRYMAADPKGNVTVHVRADGTFSVETAPTSEQGKP